MNYSPNDRYHPRNFFADLWLLILYVWSRR